MDETVTTVEQQSADQQDAFLAGWDDESPETYEDADQQTEEAEETEEQQAAEDDAVSSETSDEESGEADADTTAEQTETKTEEVQQENPPAEPTWKIKHMGAEETLTVRDITPELLQKGRDYDRIRTKYDEAKPVMEMFTAFAQKAGMSVTDYAKFIRAEAKKASGMSEEEAQRTVELEDREAAIAAKENAETESKRAADASNAKIQADLAEFAAAFPDVYKQARENPKVIPQSVWDDVNGGKMSLTAAYSKYAVAQAKAAAAAAEQRAAVSDKNQRNGARSTGSQKSAGHDVKSKDPFLDGFGD